jgi:hypothetical protein
MACNQWKDLMMGYLDNELDDRQHRQFQEHLKTCTDCAGELDEFMKLKAITDDVTLNEPQDRLWQEYWVSLYNRLERGTGWILLSLAGILLIIYGGFKAIEAVIKNPDIELTLKFGLLALLAALAILFVSVLRERLYFWRKDRYKDVRR